MLPTSGNENLKPRFGIFGNRVPEEGLYATALQNDSGRGAQLFTEQIEQKLIIFLHYAYLSGHKNSHLSKRRAAAPYRKHIAPNQIGDRPGPAAQQRNTPRRAGIY